MKLIEIIGVLGEDAEQLKSAVKRVPMLELMVCVHEPVPEVMVAVAIEMSVALSGSVTDALIVNEWPIDAFVIELIVALVGGELMIVTLVEFVEAVVIVDQEELLAVSSHLTLSPVE